jgi:hypothetical protein
MAQSDRPAYTARPGEAVQVFRDGDGSFAIGVGRIRIAAPDGEDMAYVAAVVDDLGRLAHLPAGEEALCRGDAIGHPVLIVKPSPPTEPANAWAIPDDLASATMLEISVRSADGGAVQGTGTGCGSTIVYDPADWPEIGDLALPSRTDILLTMIEQANANAAGKSNPMLPGWGIPLRS